MADDIVVEPLAIETDDGITVHGDAATPRAPRAAAAICHPHPRMGGDRHNGVVDALFRALPRQGIASVRIDFRGVGRSTGTYGAGVGERHDAVAALCAAAALAPGRPLWAIGYSFGADVALSVDHPGVAGWIALAAPLAVVADEPPAAGAGRPTMLVVPSHDQFRAPEAARAATAAWHDTTVVELEMADHSMVGRLAATVEVVTDALTRA